MDCKRSLKRQYVSPTKRLFSTIVIKENNVHTKTVVPSHWVDPCKTIMFYPPRGRKTVGIYLSEWAEPEVGWQEFELIEYILEAGSYETCQAMLMFQTEDEDDDVPISQKCEVKETARVASPKIKIGAMKNLFRYDEEDDIPISQKCELKETARVTSPKIKIRAGKKLFRYDEEDDIPFDEKERISGPELKISGVKELFSPTCTPKTTNSPFQFSSSEFFKSPSKRKCLNLDSVGSSKVVDDDDDRLRHKCIDKLKKNGDGGVLFREMANKHFQYALFMDLQKNFRLIQESQAQIFEMLRIIEQSGDVDFDVNVNDVERDPANSIEQFDAMENILNRSSNARKRKVTQMRGVGGPTARKTVKNILNNMMTQEMQLLFSKDGRKGNRKFTSTGHYKCIKDAIVGDKNGYDASSIDSAIGDILKRAKK